jgi:UDPglucose--hexose-1-phosphate uridylyltransferase
MTGRRVRGDPARSKGELRVDPHTGRQVVIAPGRALRPGAARGELEPPTPEELDTCPFCAGREDRTPPETLRLPAGATDWSVRVVPNLYPAFERQEVVVHTPRHARSIGELEDDELELVAEAWRQRVAAEPGGYVHAIVNEGRDAGASLPHTHSQLVWLGEPPPAVGTERGLPEGEPVLAGDGVRATCPHASRVPYEVTIAPDQLEPDGFTSDLLGPGLRLLAECIRRLRRIQGPVPVNAWLHNGVHWHLELVPRLTVIAGIELGAGIYVNPLAPEDAAEHLREA